jgi:DNA-nicking Smr family endonuclease
LKSAGSPPLAPLGRKLKKRVARGAHAIDGRIDLHGLTQAQAHDALLHFLRTRQARGARLVLIITGKGFRGDMSVGERGVLKRMVPMWLRLPEFRDYVIGFESAAVGHGGEGALYVTLRKSREAVVCYNNVPSLLPAAFRRAVITRRFGVSSLTKL